MQGKGNSRTEDRTLIALKDIQESEVKPREKRGLKKGEKGDRRKGERTEKDRKLANSLKEEFEKKNKKKSH